MTLSSTKGNLLVLKHVGRLFSLGLLTIAITLPALSDVALKRFVLVPLDDRPATTQFAQMIGDMAGVVVDTPPTEMLGHFTQPGKPEAIMDWLREHLSEYDGLVVDTDMIAYGGLIASRTSRSSFQLALNRLREFAKIRQEFPKLKVYGFSAVMRLAPTATKDTKAWRMNLAKFVELKELYRLQPDAKTLASLQSLRKKIPEGEIERYYAIRDRDHRIQQEILKMTSSGGFDSVSFGQDDAKPMGPHVAETRRLRKIASSLGISNKVQFSEGIDQLGCVLLSKALMDGDSWTPKIRVVYADQAGRQKVAFYESETIDNSLRDQILGSGADFAKPGETYDYSLYVNTPDPRAFSLDAFLQSMKSEVDQGFPVAIADVNLGAGGIADPRLYEAVTSQGRSSRILAYAGWNTAGNTMGTTIPAANVYMLARRMAVDPLQREVGLRAFILHRLVNDFEYHKYVRPEAYAMIDKFPNGSREETYGTEFEKVSSLVKKDLGERLEMRFKEQLLGTRFFAGTNQYEVINLDNVAITLPWPRAYEVKLTFKIEVESVKAASPKVDFSKFPILPLGGLGGK